APVQAPAADSQPAAAAVAVRSGRHDTHTRVVFDWPAATGYAVSEPAPGRIAVTFRTPASFDMTGIRHDEVLQGASAAGQSVTLNVSPGATHRHFLIGSKIVLDIFKP